MADWTSIADTSLEIGKPIRSIDIVALRDNVTAAFEKASGAPVLANDYVVTAMIAAAQVTQAKMANSSVGQAQLKTTTGEVSTAFGSGGGNALHTLPGGSYGFYPQLKNSPGTAGLGFTLAYDSAVTGGINSSYTTQIWFYYVGGSGATTSYAQQRYVQASPPYDLGDGEIPLFVFALVDNGTGEIISTYVAEDPPWANNGPTNIRPDVIDPKTLRKFKRVRVTKNITLDAVKQDPTLMASYVEELRNTNPSLVEITQAMKNADIGVVPHPFIGNDMTGKSVVLLDPVSPMMSRLHDLKGQQHGLISELLHSKNLLIRNEPLTRSGPQGVIVVPPSWKLTR